MSQSVALLVGYVLGTLQVLTIDWVRLRREHRVQLRTLRAELKRVLHLGEKFDWDEAGPKEDVIPKPPSVSPTYADLVTRIDFSLTDEFEGDNTQEVLLGTLDGCEVLQDTLSQARSRIEELRTEAGPDRRQRSARDLVQLAESYDEKLDVLRYSVNSAIRDIDRRLEEVGLRRQIVRQFHSLPHGENPQPLAPGDPRLQSGNEGNDA